LRFFTGDADHEYARREREFYTNKVVITKDGENLAEKEINNDRHFANLLSKFRQDQAYKDSLTGGV
jgi:hypothetical protein